MAATPLSQTTCLIHLDRPATARCPSCRTFYCGECITEHDGRLTCARCLAGEKEKPAEKSSRFSLPLMPVVHLAIAVMLCWAFYYLFAQLLGNVPDAFHDGTIWTESEAAPAEAPTAD